MYLSSTICFSLEIKNIMYVGRKKEGIGNKGGKRGGKKGKKK